MRAPDQDEIVFWEGLLKDVDDLNVEALRLGSTERGETVALHAWLDFACSHDRDRKRVLLRCGGLGALRRRGASKSGDHQGQAFQQQNGS